MASGCAGMFESIQVVNDPFAGPTRQFTMMVRGDESSYYFHRLVVKEAQGKVTLQLFVTQTGAVDAVASVGDKAEFLLGGEILTLENATEGHPVAHATQGGLYTEWETTFNLSPQQAARFAATPLSAIKAHVAAHQFQVALDGGQATRFQANMAVLTTPAASPSMVAAAPAKPSTPAK
jgi:hypothetical protein